MKHCTKCRRALPAECFASLSRSRDGLYPSCKDCERASRAAFRQQNRERLRLVGKAHYARNAETIKSVNNAYYRTNRDAARMSQARYYQRDSATFKMRANNRRALLLRATPAWVNHAKIREIYEIAGLLTTLHGVPYDVDHIVPLHSKFVCGLNWEGNLQVLPMSQNRAKRNRFWPDMP